MTEEDFEALRPAADALAEVRDAFRDDFAYSDFTETGFVVAFVGAAPEEAIQILAAPGIPYELIENVGYSERQVDATLAEVTEEVRLRTKGEISFEVSADPRNGSFDVTLYDVDGAVTDEMLASVGAIESDLGLVVDVVVLEGITIAPLAGVGDASSIDLPKFMDAWLHASAGVRRAV